MATYIKGVTDYIPQIQPWSPDYNFYQNTLERKQAKYDRGWEQVNSIYNSILNAPMMRGENVERRDNFFKNVEQQIQQMSDVDLSLAQNVDSASQVFKPFYEDENIIHDISYTKRYQDELQNAEYLKNCADPKKCGDKYWSGGVKAMQYKAQEFVNASDSEALRMAPPTYTNYFNFMKNAQDAVKEAGFKMVEDKIQGGYKVTTTNGKQMIAPLREFMMARFGDNPQWQDYNKTKAYLLRKENPEAAVNIYEQQALRSKAKSQEEYQQLVQEKEGKSKLEGAKRTINANAAAEKSGLDKMIERKAILQGIVDTEGLVPGSEDDKAYMQVSANLPVKERAERNARELASTYNKLNYVDEEGRVISNDLIDQAVANAMMIDEINSTSNILAYKDASVTKTADPFALAGYKHKLGMQRDAFKASLTASKTNAAETVKYIRKTAETGTREDVARADYIDNLIIEKGYTEEQALNKYRTDYNRGIIKFEYPADKKQDPDEGKLSTGKAKGDASIQKQIIEASRTESPQIGEKLVNNLNTVTTTMYQAAQMNAENVARSINDVGVKAISGVINDLVTNPNAKREAASTLGYIGDLMAKLPPETIEKLKNKEVYDGVMISNVYDKYFVGFPTSESGYTRDNEAVNNIKNDPGAVQNIIDAIGPNEMFNILTTAEDNEEGNYLNKLLGVDYADDLTEITWGKQIATTMKANLDNQIIGAANVLGADTEGESLVTNIMKKNILVDKAGMKLIAKPSDMYYKIAKNSGKLLPLYDEDNITSGISPSITEIETNLSEGKDNDVFFEGDNLKGLLVTSDAQPFDAIDLDYKKLYKDNSERLPGNQDIRGRTISGSETRNKVWNLLLNDDNTEVVRSEKDPSKMIIKSPYFASGHSQLFDLSDIDAHNGVQEMFKDVDDEYSKVASKFGNELQRTTDNQAFGVSPDNIPSANPYNIVSKTMTDIKIDPVDPIVSYNEVVDLGQEIETNFDAKLPTGYEQGPKDLLDMYLATTKKSYKPAEKKAAPKFNIEYNSNTGVRGLTSYTITMDDINKELVAKSLGKAILKNEDPDDKTTGTYVDINMPTTGTFYIQDSQSELIQKANPDMYLNTFNTMGPKDVFTDDSPMTKGFGFTKYTKVGADDLEMVIYNREYNPDTGEYGDYRPAYREYIEDYRTLRGGWENKIKKNNRMLYRVHEEQMKIYRDSGILKTSKSYQ